MRSFPDEFLFGCATSAYQIEGGIENDWSSWERAGRLKDPSGRCGPASDHWRRWESDFELLSALGASAYRMSIEWARVEPESGHIDRTALEAYARMIDALLERQIEPFVTLLHFTHPPWFHEQCPWDQADGSGPERFRDFVGEVARVIGDRVRYFTVLNEPAVWLSGAYLAGLIPPGTKGLRRLAAAMKGLVRGHAFAREVLKARGGDRVRVGVAHNVVRFEPDRSGHPLDRIAASYVARQFNHAVPGALTTGVVQLGMTPGVRIVSEVPEAKNSLDFLGINYYSRVFIRANALPVGARRFVEAFYEDRGAHGITDLGWEIHPQGLTEMLVDMARYALPIYVTENGLDDRDDSRRATYLYDHLGAVLDAIERGVDVRGYLFWSLIDNFEWLEGFDPRFGLFRVDYDTYARTATQAVKIYADVIRQRALGPHRPSGTIRRGERRVPVG